MVVGVCVCVCERERERQKERKVGGIRNLEERMIMMIIGS